VLVAELTRVFAGHPGRLAGALGGAAVLAIIVWYLGSPLFVRTYRSEGLPSVPPPASAGPTSAAGTPPASAPASPRVLRSGELGYVDAIHNGKGPVRLIDVSGQRYLRFDDVMITNAPDVHVYLSKETGGKWSDATSAYLGPLKATNGSFNYELPAELDVAQYHSVVVWCRAFRVLITWADLGGG
jgi:hypothetical protein